MGCKNCKRCEYTNCWAFNHCKEQDSNKCGQKVYYENFNELAILDEIDGIQHHQYVKHIGDLNTEQGFKRLYVVISDMADPSVECYLDNLIFSAVIIEYLSIYGETIRVDVYNEVEDIAYYLGLITLKESINKEAYDKLF